MSSPDRIACPAVRSAPVLVSGRRLRAGSGREGSLLPRQGTAHVRMNLRPRHGLMPVENHGGSKGWTPMDHSAVEAARRSRGGRMSRSTVTEGGPGGPAGGGERKRVG